MNAQTPPGWYPDSTNPGQQRYWDGSQWTDYTAPAAAGGPQAPGQAVAVAQPGYGVPAAGVANPYDKYYNVDALPAEQREAWKQHSLTEFPSWAVVVLSIITFGIFGIVYHGLKHGKLPQLKREDPSAGKAIGFSFIPFFSLYWIFPMWMGLCDRINFQYRLRGAPEPLSRDLAMWTNIMLLSSFVVGITILAWPVMACIVAAQIQTAANKLARNEVGPSGYAGGYAPVAQPAPAPPPPA